MITGTNGDDHLTGTESADTIILLGGDNSIRLAGVERISLTPDDFLFI